MNNSNVHLVLHRFRYVAGFLLKTAILLLPKFEDLGAPTSKGTKLIVGAFYFPNK